MLFQNTANLISAPLHTRDFSRELGGAIFTNFSYCAKINFTKVVLKKGEVLR